MYIYVIRCGDGPKQRCKIGISGSPQNRLHHLQGSSPWPMTLDYQWEVPRDLARPIEREVHERLKPRRVRVHGEWFKIDPGNAAAAVLRVLYARGVLTWPSQEDP